MVQIGMYGSPAHIATNKNIEPKDKAKAILKTYGETCKDTVKFGAGAATTAGAAALAVGTSTKAAGIFEKVLGGIGDTLSKVRIQGTGPKGGPSSLKSILKDSTFAKKFMALPKPTQAAILVGTAVLTLGLPLLSISSASKCGYIEASAEKKVQE